MGTETRAQVAMTADIRVAETARRKGRERVVGRGDRGFKW